MNENLKISRPDLTLKSIGALMIVSGVILTDKAVDKGSKSDVGKYLFILGWFVVAYSTSDKMKNKSVFFSALFVLAMAMFAQKQMHEVIDLGEDEQKAMIGMGVFSLAWFVFAFHLNKQNKVKSLIPFISAGAVILSMMILKNNRFYGNPISKVNIYNFGLPLFVIGWVGIIISSSLL